MYTITNLIIAILVLAVIVAIYKWVKKNGILLRMHDKMLDVRSLLSTVTKSLKDGKITKAEAASIVEKAKAIIDGG